MHDSDAQKETSWSHLRLGYVLYLKMRSGGGRGKSARAESHRSTSLMPLGNERIP